MFLEEVKLYRFYCDMPCALHHSFCIGSYVVYLRSQPYQYSILHAAPYLVGYEGRRYVAFALICIRCTVGRDVLSLFLLEVNSLYIILSLVNTEVQF
jgi:hypothetical protein